MRFQSIHFGFAIAGALLLVAGGSSNAQEWKVPVEKSSIVKGFNYGGRSHFQAGQHRGIDFAAQPGSAVRAACGGRVLFSGSVGTHRQVLSMSCGGWRVSYMPIRKPVTNGRYVKRGQTIGLVGSDSDHAGLHIGVRKEGDRFGYVDPTRFFEPTAETLPPPTVSVKPHSRPSASVPYPPALPIAQPQPILQFHAHRTLAPQPVLTKQPRPKPTAVPWLVWPALTVLLMGVMGTSMKVKSKRAQVRSVAAKRRQALARIAR